MKHAGAPSRPALWATLLAPALALALALVVATGCSRSVDVEPGSTLVVEMGGAYVEAPAPSPFAALAGDPTSPFIGLLSTFSMVERDDRIDTVLMLIRPMQIGWGKADEIREAIGRARAAGRRTVALIESQGLSPNKELFIAAAADEAYVTPGSSLPLVGLAAEYLFLAGFWERLGVEFEVARAGRYKSAIELFSERGMSEASREMANSLLDDTFDRFVTGLAEGRGLSPMSVAEAIDRAPVRSQSLEAIGLIDGEAHLDQLLERIGGPVVREKTYGRVDPEDVGFEAEAEIALVYGAGTVVQGESGGSPFASSPVMASETVAEAIEEAAENDDIVAIVLRIDSPGGSALASELIWRAVDRARAAGKPVIASFSDVAASGGYYVAAGADAIVSDPGTLTGSIGVFALRPSLGGLLDKLDIGIDALTRGKHADYLVASERMSPASLERLQASVLDTYQLFLQRVADGRSLSIEKVDQVAQGRVWTGRQALAAGLVDELGGLYTAVRRAKEAAGLDVDADVYLVPYPKPRAFTDQVVEALFETSARLGPAGIDWPAPLDRVAEMATQLPTGSPLMIPPVMIEIH